MAGERVVVLRRDDPLAFLADACAAAAAAISEVPIAGARDFRHEGFPGEKYANCMIPPQGLQ